MEDGASKWSGWHRDAWPEIVVPPASGSSPDLGFLAGPTKGWPPPESFRTGSHASVAQLGRGATRGASVGS